MVVGEAGGLDPAHLQALECDTQEGHGELGTQSLPLLAGVEHPAELGLLPAGLLGHIGLGPGILTLNLADSDDPLPLQGHHGVGQARFPPLSVLGLIGRERGRPLLDLGQAVPGPDLRGVLAESGAQLQTVGGQGPVELAECERHRITVREAPVPRQPIFRPMAGSAAGRPRDQTGRSP